MCRDCGCGLPGQGVGIHTGHEHSHAHEHEHAHAHGDHTHAHPHAHEHSHGHEHGAGHEHGHTHEHLHDSGEPHEHSHGHEHDHSHEHGHSHDHSHEQGHGHAHAHPHEEPEEHRRVLEIRQGILDKNDRQAERNRGFFRGRGLLAINVLSSPGSGKTTLLRETIQRLKPRMQSAVVVGDLATDNDARRLRESGAPVIQVTTGTMCHLEATMVARAVKEIDLAATGLLIIENVGNLVCPASYDLGEDFRVVLLSVTEGEDKPLKYPPMFQSAHAVVISKIDLAEACGFNRELALANIRKLAPQAKIFELSAKTGAGMDAWTEFLVQERARRQTENPLGV